VTAPARRAVTAFGDGALVLGVATTAEAHAAAELLRGYVAGGGPPWLGVEDVVVGSRSVTVIADPVAADLDAMAHALARLAPPPATGAPSRVAEVAVVFDGPDLDEVAALAGLDRGEVIAQLTRAELDVAFVGFLPGFAYLEGLAPSLARVPRRRTPRPRVAAGSVALGGGFAGIYPQASPGGWHLVGRTAFRLFDPAHPPFATLRPGDRVRLRPDDGRGGPLPQPGGTVHDRGGRRGGRGGTIVVEEPGLLSTVQDLGRIGVAALGVPRAGAACPVELRAGNRLLGNADDAPGIEVTARGPTLRFDGPAHVAVVGAPEARLDGLRVAPDTVIPVEAGQVLAVGATGGGLRAYVAVAGGIAEPPVLGSASSDVLTGLGPGPLRRGDVLATGSPGRLRGTMRRTGPLLPPPAGGPRRVRILAGPDAVAATSLSTLSATTWEVTAESDRMGLRLRGATTVVAPSAGIPSRAVVTGAVQVPADGAPVVLLCDHATVGGYPVVATVVSADLGVVGACRPGDRLRLELVDLDEARRARTELELALDRAVTGWYPVRAG